ncbi:MAG: DnaJ domain-containing protein [Bacilli bacterium]|nr:DnaJ domain-containing protein [Bacilli bacterium]
MNDYINYYDLLGVDKNASSEEIKKAYRNHAKKWHPDLNKDPKAPEMAKKINEAKEILLDETKRKDYDQYLDNYKNNIYDNLDKQNKKNETYKKYNYDDSKNDYYEEKTYTKWQYFLFYLKYYKVSILRKFLSLFLVLLESLICTILQIIIYILAFILSYFGFYIATGSIIIGIVLLFLIIAKPLLKTDLPPNNTLEFYIFGFSSIISILFGYLLPEVLHIMVNKIPVGISKLNLFLFKKSIGYKKMV